MREKAKGLVALLKDDERLKNERAKALKAKERFTENFGIGSDSTSVSFIQLISLVISEEIMNHLSVDFLVCV